MKIIKFGNISMNDDGDLCISEFKFDCEGSTFKSNDDVYKSAIIAIAIEILKQIESGFTTTDCSIEL